MTHTPMIIRGCHLDERRAVPSDLLRFKEAILEGRTTCLIGKGREIRVDVDGDTLILNHDLSRDRDAKASDIQAAVIDAITLLAERGDWTTKAENPEIDTKERKRFALMAAMCRAHDLHNLPMLSLLEASPFESYCLLAGDHRWHGVLDVRFTPLAIQALDAIAPRCCNVRWIRNNLIIDWSRGYPNMLGETPNAARELEEAGLLGVDCIKGITRGLTSSGSLQVIEERQVPSATRKGPTVFLGDIPGYENRISNRQMQIGTYDSDGMKITDARIVYRGIALVSQRAIARELDQMEDVVDLLDQGSLHCLEEIRSDTREGRRFEASFKYHIPEGAVENVVKAFETIEINADRIEIRLNGRIVHLFESKPKVVKAA